MKIIEYVVVPCPMTEDGRIEMRPTHPPPYGYHHIVGINSDRSIVFAGSIICTVSIDRVIESAKILAGNLPVRSDEFFYVR